jgi:hypothetical protein
MRAWSLPVAVAASVVLTTCDHAPVETPLERSCRGDRYLECDPYEYTVVREASLEPSGISPLDPAARARVRAVIDRCPTAPGFAEIQLAALLAVDAGRVRFVDLGIALHDDGRAGDAVAGDGVIDAEIGNPFGREIPGDAMVQIRFAPVLAGCAGDVLEIAYRTGPRG